MGTDWSVQIDVALESAAMLMLQRALQTAVDAVDDQMSTWKPGSDLMQFIAASIGRWLPLPAGLLTVLAAGLGVSRSTAGAFEMNVGDAVWAWGFGAEDIDLVAIRAASDGPRIRAQDVIELDLALGLARKVAPVALDLSGIAKGYGVDRLAEVALAHGVTHALCAIDGELRAVGGRADGSPWAIQVEQPDHPGQEAHSMLMLTDGAVATSGDYRHFVSVAGKRLAHTIDPKRGAPLVDAPASVTVVGQTCMLADAMATALMVMGPHEGCRLAAEQGISALILLREGDGFRSVGTGMFVC
jgi:thiamine biosynthesis lipoprotein